MASDANSTKAADRPRYTRDLNDYSSTIPLRRLMLSMHSQTISLPPTPENDWRFSYQFAPRHSALVARVVFGIGVLGFMIVVAHAAW